MESVFFFLFFFSAVVVGGGPLFPGVLTLLPFDFICRLPPSSSVQTREEGARGYEFPSPPSPSLSPRPDEPRGIKEGT